MGYEGFRVDWSVTDILSHQHHPLSNRSSTVRLNLPLKTAFCKRNGLSMSTSSSSSFSSSFFLYSSFLSRCNAITAFFYHTPPRALLYFHKRCLVQVQSTLPNEKSFAESHKFVFSYAIVAICMDIGMIRYCFCRGPLGVVYVGIWPNLVSRAYRRMSHILYHQLALKTGTRCKSVWISGSAVLYGKFKHTIDFL